MGRIAILDCFEYEYEYEHEHEYEHGTHRTHGRKIASSAEFAGPFWLG